MELNDELYERVEELSQEGDDLVEQEEYEAGIAKYKEALALVPEPKIDWEASTWLYTAIGEAYYFNNQEQQAVDNFSWAQKCPGGLENPFILLRMGECFYCMNNIEKARNYLLQAYMLEGREIFEEEDERIFNVIKDLI